MLWSAPHSIVAHKLIPPCRSSADTTHQAITYRTLLDPPDSQTKRAFQISSKQANKQQTKPSQHTKPPAKANNPPSADGQTHPLYYSLHLPIKQKWVSCGLKALAESTQVCLPHEVQAHELDVSCIPAIKRHYITNRSPRLT